MMHSCRYSKACLLMFIHLDVSSAFVVLELPSIPISLTSTILLAKLISCEVLLFEYMSSSRVSSLCCSDERRWCCDVRRKSSDTWKEKFADLLYTHLRLHCMHDSSQSFLKRVANITPVKLADYYRHPLHDTS